MDLSIDALREAYETGRTTPLEVVEFVLSRLDDADQESVWISVVDHASALARAAALGERIGSIDQLPLYGLPFSVKDNIDVEGQPTTAACPAFGYVAKTSAHVVAEALAAGAIYIGKTNLDQFATGLVGVRSPYGVPRNPFNPDYIPGGSSSGAGVSVSTGVVSFAFGTDTGGSGRVPASYNAITGLKPAPGQLSRRGLVFACRTIDTPTIFAKSGGDAKRVFDVVSSFDPRDPYAIMPGPAVHASSRAARIAAPRAADLKFFGNAETEAFFANALAQAESAFCAIARADFTQFTRLNDLMFFGPLLAERDASIGAFVSENEGACDPNVSALVLGSRSMSAADAYRAQYQIADAKVETSVFWESHDVLMVPTVGDILKTADVKAEPLKLNFNNGYYTNFANPLGLVAVATPFAMNAEGVPWGVTFLAKPEFTDDLLGLADAFSAAVR
ncbi:MAG: allophanate hydrolase [Pseudomonadota bacterium]